MDILRTPDERFAHLPDFPWEGNYVEVNDGVGGRLRVAYLDEGRAGQSPCCSCTESRLGRSSTEGWCRLFSVLAFGSSSPTLWASVAPTSRLTDGTTPTPGMSSGCVRPCSMRSGCPG